jgi:diaminohydroxyphosphoribosylaminopyrimidine deaminase/5-amino-6-(5-phosphoribosylamino)uracil reductase
VIPPGAVLDLLGRHEMTNVMVEGGGRTLGLFHDERLADEYQIYIAPILIGGRQAAGPLGALGPQCIRDALCIEGAVRLTRLGNGWFVRALPQPGN